MTTQIMDTIYLHGHKHDLASESLKEYWETEVMKRYWIIAHISACRREGTRGSGKVRGRDLLEKESEM